MIYPPPLHIFLLLPQFLRGQEVRSGSIGCTKGTLAMRATNESNSIQLGIIQRGKAQKTVQKFYSRTGAMKNTKIMKLKRTSHNGTQ